MRYTGGVFALALIGLVISPAWGADQPLPLHFTPAGPWAVTSEEGACFLKGEFQNGDKKVHLAARQSVPGYGLNVTMLAQGLKQRKILDPKIAFQPGEKARDIAPAVKVRGTDDSLGFRASIDFSGEVPPTTDAERVEFYANSLKKWAAGELDFANQATVIYVRGVFWDAISLNTGSLKSPFVEMRRCIDGLISDWGYDPEAFAALARYPKPEGVVSSWVHAGDYPAHALNKRQQALVSFRLDVSAGGDVTDCEILYLQGPEIFGETVCRALRQRAQFLPALDENGNAVPSFFASQVGWFVG